MRRTALCAAFLLAASFGLGPAAGAAPASTDAAAALAIVIYDQPNFKGRQVTLAQPTPDLAALGFDDRVASLVVTGVGDWVLCEHRNYGGRCVRVQGRAQDLKLLQIAGRVSSLYPVPLTVTPAKP